MMPDEENTQMESPIGVASTDQIVPGDTLGVEPGRASRRIVSPKLFGRHRIVLELATGGMATVYLARSEGPARHRG